MRVSIAVVALAFLLVGGGSAPLFAQEEGDAQTQDFTAAIRAADHVVTGRVLGVVDTGSDGPISAARKLHEAHWVVVRGMLKGHDIMAHRIRVRPNTLEWQDGNTYVLFLKDLGRGCFDAIPQPVLYAASADIAADVKRLGFRVLPSLRLKMRLYGGGCSVHHGVLKELRVTGDGAFTFEELVTDASGYPLGQKDVRTGVLPTDALATLARELEGVKLVPMPDGGGILDFEFCGDSGEAKIFTFNLLSQPEAPGILETLAKQARLAAPKAIRVEVVKVK